MTATQQSMQLSHSAEMMEHNVLEVEPPLADQLDERFVVVQDRTCEVPRTELLAVSTENHLQHYVPDPSSSSGWRYDKHAVPGAPDGAIQKILAFYLEHELHAFVHYPAGEDGADEHNVVCIKRTAGEWSAVELDNDATNALTRTRQAEVLCAADGTCYLYGISTNAIDPMLYICSRSSKDSTWVTNFFEVVPSASTTYRLISGAAAGELTVLRIADDTITFRQGAVGQDDRFRYTAKEHEFKSPVGGDLDASRILPVPGPGFLEAFFLLSKDSQLYYVFRAADRRFSVHRLSGEKDQPAGLTTAVAGVDSDGAASVFGIDTAHRRLWTLRQTNANDAQQSPVFSSWVQLGDAVASIACPISMEARAQLFAVDIDRRLIHLAQSVGDGTWFSKVLQTPAPRDEAPKKTTSYAWEISASDAAGLPAPGALLDITANRPVVVYVNGMAYHVDSEHGATVSTDSAGRLTAFTAASGLASPELRVRCSSSASDEEPQAFRADELAHRRLAGLDPDFEVSAAELEKHGVIPKADPDAEHMVSAIKSAAQALAARQAGAKLVRGSAALDLARVQDTCWEIDVSDGRFRYRAITDPVEVAAVGAATAGGVGGVLSDLWGDVAHLLKHVYSAVEKFVVQVTDDVVHFVVHLGKEVKRFVLETIDQIVDVFEVVVSWAKKAVDAIIKAIEWLAALFRWQDIKRTEEVLHYLVDQGLEQLATAVKGLGSSLSGHIDEVGKQITGALDKVEQAFAAGTSFNALVGGPSGVLAGASPPLEARATKQAYAGHSVMCNYVHASANAHAASFAIAAPAVDAASTGLDELVDAMKRAFPADKIQPSLDRIQQLFTHIRKPADLLDAAVLTVLEVIKDIVALVIECGKEVVILLAKLVAGAIRSLRSMLEQRIDIPVISWLFKELTGCELTLLHLLTFGLATFTTVLYKVIHGTAPFPDQSSVDAITRRPLPWPGVAGALLEDHPLLGDDLDSCFGAIGQISWTCYAVLDPILDIEASENKVVKSLAITSVAAGSLIQLTALPGIVKACRRWKGADEAAVVNWAVAWAPIVLDTGCIVAHGKLARALDKWGPILESILGAAVLGTGIWAVVEMHGDDAYSGWSQAETLLAPVPVAGKFLINLGEDALIGLCIGDMLCDLGAGVCRGAGSS